MTVQCVNTKTVNQEIVAEAVDKIEAGVTKLVDQPLGIRIRFDRLRHMERVSASVKVGRGRLLVASGESGDIYEALDQLAQRISAQARRRKGRMSRRRNDWIADALMEVAS